MQEKDKIDFSMFLDEYLSDAKEGFQRISSALLTLEKDHSQTEQLDVIFRVVHSLKSSSTMLKFLDVTELAHTSEDLLDQLRKKKLPVTQEAIDVMFEVFDKFEKMVIERAKGKSEKIEFQDVAKKVENLIQGINNREKDEHFSSKTPVIPIIEKVKTVRVNVNLLDSLFNLVGELIITKNRIDNIVTNIAKKELKAALASMDHIINELQENVSIARLVPISEIAQKFPRMVRDLAKNKNKEIDLVFEGIEIELDKQILDNIGEPLVHLLRNAVDHGIEAPQVRQKRKKKRSGIIKLSAERTENQILITVEDDGNGIDTAHLKEVYIKKGLIESEKVKSMKDNDILESLFEAGFSSSEEVTDVSGRGVGLDVVKTSVNSLGGAVEVTTQKGKGTRFMLKLPLTTAVIHTLLVSVGEHIFAIPSNVVLETLEINSEDIKEIQNEQMFALRKEVMPFIKLSDVLNISDQKDQQNLNVIVISIGNKLFGLGVDMVVDQMENIIKSFDPIAQQFKGFSGGTILGDGSVALLLDIPNLFDFEK